MGKLPITALAPPIRDQNELSRLVTCFVTAVLVFAIMCSVSALGARDNPELEDLQWMAGRWVGTERGVEMEELWTHPKGGVMLGIHRDVAPGGSAFFEYLRIEDREGSLVYVASPKGEGATDFFLVSVGEQEVIFENLDHDFPQRIVYRREEDRLIARIEGEVAGEPRSREWEWRLHD